MIISVVIVCTIFMWIKFRKTDEGNSLTEELLKLREELQNARLKDREHLQNRIDHVSKILQEHTQQSTKTLQGQFRQSTDIIKQVTEKLTKLDETNTQVMNFSEQLHDLQAILKNPKGRGVLSEYWLETMLGHVLQPEQYKMQYTFSDGEIVDAVVFFQKNIIPIDAKFSADRFNQIASEKNAKIRETLEKEFKQDLKLRIDETAKYIRPSENTTEFAFMFIPADGIYHDLLVNRVGTVEVNKLSLMEYAFGKRVIIVSPSTFFAYLQTVLQGLKAFKMEESVRDVLKKVEQLGKHLGSFETYITKLGNNLGTSVSMYNQAYKEFQKVDKDVLKLTEGKVGGSVEVMELEKPAMANV